MARLLALLTLCLSLCAPALAISQDDQTRRLYESASDLLRAGKDFNKVIQRLEAVVAREPANAQYQSARGCAYASRFASIAVALKLQEQFEDLSRLYESTKKQWDTDQQNPMGSLNGLPEPMQPSPPSTLDDGQAFTMKPYEARMEMLRLGRRALDAFGMAKRAGETLTEEARIRLDWERGWGLFLMRQFGEGIVTDVQPAAKSDPDVLKTGPLPIPPQSVVECFDRCTRADPKDPDLVLYHYALALAHAPKSLGWAAFTGGAGGQTLYVDDQIKAATAALEKALAVQGPHRPSLILTGLLLMDKDPGKTAEWLEKAARLDAENAVAWYQVGEARFLQAEQQKEAEAKKTTEMALKSIMRGNRAGRYQAIRIDTPAPPLLQKAWGWVEAYGIPDDYMAVNLAADVMLSAREEAKRGETGEAIRLYRIECDMGARALGAMDGADLDVRLPRSKHAVKMRRMFGALHFLTGYKEMDALNRQQPDAQVTAFLAENARRFEEAKVLERMLY